MLRSIVVPLDGTPTSEEPLPLADRIAAATGATLHLVHVVPAETEAVYPHEGTGLPPQSRVDDPTEARAALDAIRDRAVLTPPDRIEVEVLSGSIVPSLLHYLDEAAADLVIMASKAPGPLGRILLGSVADDVVRSGRLPVLVVPVGRGSSPPADSEIVVAIDGSSAAETVLPAVTALALAFGARLTLLRVLAVQIAGGYLPPGRAKQWECDMQEAERHLDRVRNRLRDRGVRTDAMVLTHPSPAQAICEVAEEVGAGLIAMGTQGRGAIEAAVLGSVAQGVLAEAPCPVLVRRGQ